MKMRVRRTLAACALLMATSAAVQAQQPETPAPDASSGSGFADKAQAWAKKHQIMERLTGEVDGFYPRLGRMTRGGGFALGPGYRFHPMGGPVLIDLSAGISTKAYKSAEARVRWFRDDRFEVWTEYRFEDFPQEDYFGVGFASLLDTRTSYGFESHDIGARVVYRALPWLRVGAGTGYMTVDTGPGADKNYPSIEEIFTDADAPGLLDQPDFLHSTLFGEVDWRDVPGNPGSGGFYRVAYSAWNDRSFDRYDFIRFDVNLTQFVPLEPSKKHVVAGRLGLAYTNNDDGSRMPFYFLPYVGGVDTIRSFREFRFKEENAMWLGAEYLFRPIAYVNFAAFVDAGKVDRDWQDIDFTGMKTGYGVGLRFGTKTQQMGRLDFGFGGGEGTRVFFKIDAGL
jgi:outer membrane protein assembly factor BamA